MNQKARPAATVGFSGAANRRGAAHRWLSAHYALALFIALCLVPTAVATVYFGLIASDRYISETRFVVRSADKPAADGASSYLRDFGISRANDDAFAVHDYIASRDAMRAIMAKVDLRQIWRPEGADPLSRYGELFGKDSDEALFRYYLKQIKVEKNLETGITTVRATAFRPENANALARMIVQLSEAKVNAMNARARRDRVDVVTREVAAASSRLAEVTVQLTRYRDRSQVIDPGDTAEATSRQQSALESERAQVSADLAGMVARAPGNPAVPALRRRLGALDAEVAAQSARLTGGSHSLAGTVGGYEQLMVERELASKLYESAQKQLDTAIDEANRQQVFLDTVTVPNLPDRPAEPRRARYIFTVALLSFWIFLSFYLLVSGSREHLNLS